MLRLERGVRAGSEVACNAEVVIDGATDGNDARDDGEQAERGASPKNLANTPDEPENANAYQRHDRWDARTSIAVRLGHDLTAAPRSRQLTRAPLIEDTGNASKCHGVVTAEEPSADTNWLPLPGRKVTAVRTRSADSARYDWLQL